MYFIILFYSNSTAYRKFFMDKLYGLIFFFNAKGINRVYLDDNNRFDEKKLAALICFMFF